MSAAAIQQIKSEGIYLPSWATQTLPQSAYALATPTPTFTHKSTALRAIGGTTIPSGKRVMHYQDALVPFNEKINTLRIEPEQYSPYGYAYYNTAFNSQYQPTPKKRSSSSRFATIPVQYSRGMFNWMNPQAGFFR